MHALCIRVCVFVNACVCARTRVCVCVCTRIHLLCYLVFAIAITEQTTAFGIRVRAPDTIKYHCRNCYVGLGCGKDVALLVQ